MLQNIVYCQRWLRAAAGGQVSLLAPQVLQRQQGCLPSFQPEALHALVSSGQAGNAVR